MELNFEQIKRMHLEQKLSVLKISEALNVSRDTIYRFGKSRGLIFRNSREAAIAKTANKGKGHWAYGLNKKTSVWANKTSTRMKKNNPSHMPGIREKISRSISETFRSNPWPQEILFREILDKYRIEYTFQYPIGPFIIDFFIASKNLCIEIDTINHWGKERRTHANKKDKFLFSLGYDVLRIPKEWLLESDIIETVLKARVI